MNKLKASLGLIGGYWACCNLIWQLIECLVETILVILCIPFTPIICLFAACEKEEAEPEELDTLVKTQLRL